MRATSAARRELIELGARLQVLESETALSRERLLRLYKEIQGHSPPKGMLPFSTDWFITWMPNIHASLFMGIYQNVIQASELDEIDAIIKTYRLYLEQCKVSEQEVGAVADPRLAAGQVRRRRHAAHDPLHALRRAVRRPHPRPPRGVRLRPLPHALARGQDQGR